MPGERIQRRIDYPRSPAVSYGYDDADRLTTVTPPSPASAIDYTWDDNGDLTDRGSDSFSWDYEDRMTSATVNSVTTTFAYRGDGLRNSRTTGGNTTTFTWDINAGLPVVLDDGNQYVHGAGLASMVTGSGTYYYLADGLGSTMAMVDTSGTVQKSYTYDVYGKPTSTGGLANEFDFAGQQTDPTGLQYLRARYMDPETGTFLSREPMAVSPTWEGVPYAYSSGRPCSATDPTGLVPIDPGKQEFCSGLWTEIREIIQELNDRKEQYRADVHKIPEDAPPGTSKWGTRNGHREYYKGRQTRLNNLLDSWDDNDCGNKNGRPGGFSNRKLNEARRLAKEYNPLGQIERDSDWEHRSVWDKLQEGISNIGNQLPDGPSWPVGSGLPGAPGVPVLVW